MCNAVIVQMPFSEHPDGACFLRCGAAKKKKNPTPEFSHDDIGLKA